MKLERVSFSIDHSLCGRLDALLAASHCENRSKYLCDMIRARLVEGEWEGNQEALGTITLIYDHHQRGLGDKLTRIQHEHEADALAVTHVHLDHHRCAEMIMVRGRASQIRALADQIRRQKGVLHATLSMSSTGKALT